LDKVSRSSATAEALPNGLSSDEARARLEKSGPNEMPDTAMRPWRMALAKFWAPVPWMLEAAIVLQVVLHEYTEVRIPAIVNAWTAHRERSVIGAKRRSPIGAKRRVLWVPVRWLTILSMTRRAGYPSAGLTLNPPRCPA
jgi:hypothetical protein